MRPPPHPSDTPFRRELPGEGRHGALDYDPAFLAPAAADRALATLTAEVAFAQREIVLFGKPVLQPRLVAWMGDPDARYTYSGLSLEPAPWHPEVAALRERVVRATGVAFNSVLLNLYRDGVDSMGFHADDEPELGENPVIASVSLGAERTFVLHARRGKDEGLRIVLGHGSLLVMGGALQHTHRHGLPKERRVATPRLNLTFRRVLAR